MITKRYMREIIRAYCSQQFTCRTCVLKRNDIRGGNQCCDGSKKELRRRYEFIKAITKIKKGNDNMSFITDEERKYLLTSICNLLEKYDYSYSTWAIDEIIDTWANNKANLINAFKKHPNYVEGQFMIVFDHDYERKVDYNAIANFKRWLIYGPVCSCADDIPQEIKKLKQYDYQWLPQNLFYFFDQDLQHITTREISAEVATQINELLPDIHAHTGQKTSRVINKICTYLGYNKHPLYNKEYAKYADALSPMVIKRHTVLSLNPLDYLTMSFGNSWASCHTIDKRNQRQMPNNYEGCYSSGTISYMLDSSSMVFYTVDASANGDELWNEPKINRQMFHYAEDKLVQGRLYPQDNDGQQGKELYDSYRSIVQEIMSKIFDVDNLWRLSRGTDAAREFIISAGTHYKDYSNYDNCTLSRLKGSNNDCCFVVGHDPICIECGEEHNCEENINCCTRGVKCYECGEYVDEDDIRYIDGDPYCYNCVSYCECCGEYYTENSYYIPSEGRYVCECCFDEYYVSCEHCGENVNRTDAYYTQDSDYVCDNCFDRYYASCEDCGEVMLRNDMFMHEDDLLCENCYNDRIDAETENEEEAC